jgi:hypothetical protein
MGRNRKEDDINITDDVRRLHNSKKGLKQIKIEDFQEWYNSKNGSCDYCGLTSKQSLILFYRYPETTRGGRRGKRLELDRIDPSIRNYGEKIENLALACYWCNNAKTNYFTYDEFKEIGGKLNEVQQKRLNNLNAK